jgi:hypothetical protein
MSDGVLARIDSTTLIEIDALARSSGGTSFTGVFPERGNGDEDRGEIELAATARCGCARSRGAPPPRRSRTWSAATA